MATEQSGRLTVWNRLRDITSARMHRRACPARDGRAGMAAPSPSRFRTLGVAALAAMAAFFAQPSQPAASPTFVDNPQVMDAPTGIRVYIAAEDYFDNAGTNPVFTAAVFSTTEYYDTHEIDSGRIFVQAKTAADLNALGARAPSNPFTVTVDVTMTNDEGETASGTVEFKTIWAKDLASAQPAPSPTFIVSAATVQASPDVLVQIAASDHFDHAGTNPQFTNAVFWNTEYYNRHEVSQGQLWIRVKTAAELSAMSTPPPSPFRTDVLVTMTNDEGQTATGTITFETTYTRTSASAEEPAQGPTFRAGGDKTAPPGTLLYIGGNHFDNAGTNPQITDMQLSTTAWYRIYEIVEGRAFLMAKTWRELGSPNPPPDPVTVDVTVTMTNDEGQTATGTVRYRTEWIVTGQPAPSQPAGAPTFSQTASITAPPGQQITVPVTSVFANAGTNPVFTSLTLEGDNVSAIGFSDPAAEQDESFTLTIATAAVLNAKPSPPPSPFTTDVVVTMTNDEGQTASGTVTFQTDYTRTSASAEEPAQARRPSRRRRT